MASPAVVFRSDASLDIGTGHVMRCLTLADSLKASGADCAFISREHPGNLLGMIRDRGFTAHALSMETGPAADSPPPHAGWLGADWATDAEKTSSVLAGLPVDWLVVDHYALDARWEGCLRTNCRKLMVIDDLADRPHDCDVLLDQNLGREAGDYTGLVPAHCAILVGPRHALLRPEFAALRQYSLCRRVTPRLERLLITLGGVDRDNATGRVLEALKSCPLPEDMRIVVVMGPQALWTDQVRELARNMPRETEVRVNVSDMARLMADSDLAIGAGGGTSWERACLGLPCLLVVLADNQREGAAALGKTGGVLPLGEVDTLSDRLCAAMLESGDPGRLGAMSFAASQLADGLGISRILPSVAMESA
jgi:UDP-2,4-diacetamido-2,4,6-trideoxy-beta-L-altropyranose hydrolase